MASNLRVLAGNAPRQRRVLRSPKHPFHVQHMPFTITPFFIAPVLPGETVKNILLQSRGVSKPMVQALVGAHIEYYFFYVKLSDMLIADEAKAMILTPGRDMDDIDVTSAERLSYRKAVTTVSESSAQLPFVSNCLVAVIDNFFRDADEDYSLSAGQVSNGTYTEYLSHIRVGKDFTDSMLNATAFQEHDIDVDLDGDSTITAQEIYEAMQQWEVLKAGNLTDMDFNDYLRSQGVNRTLADADENVPEVLRVIRKWSYPVNTVDPSDGDPSTAFSWSVTETADKDRFIKEPGFLFGVTIFRPKVYLANQTASMTGFLNTVYDWLPNVMSVSGARRKYFNGTTTNSPNESDGPFDNIADDYVVDVRDLFIHGEQFTNLDLSAADGNLIAMPGTDGSRKYTTASELNTLFAGASAASGFQQDGMVSLSILGRQVDMSPTAGQEA